MVYSPRGHKKSDMTEHSHMLNIAPVLFWEDNSALASLLKHSVLDLLKDDEKAIRCFLTIFPLAKRLRDRERKKAGQLGSYYCRRKDTGLYHSSLGD